MSEKRSRNPLKQAHVAAVAVDVRRRQAWAAEPSATDRHVLKLDGRLGFAGARQLEDPLSASVEGDKMKVVVVLSVEPLGAALNSEEHGGQLGGPCFGDGRSVGGAQLVTGVNRHPENLGAARVVRKRRPCSGVANSWSAE